MAFLTSDSLVLLSTVASNCVQKDDHFMRSPWKVGISSLGSLQVSSDSESLLDMLVDRTVGGGASLTWLVDTSAQSWLMLWLKVFRSALPGGWWTAPSQWRGWRSGLE